ncbi:peptidyl-prolyl cis-trans isomerase [Candidatus Fermentibacterales bacterium]|nr:peptidyl-prolyl cis-trans isomerase [Candidatus Fermentibacterales bacterium]
MLSWLRDNAKIFLTIVVVTFVLLIFVDWGTGRDGSGADATNVVARVGDAELTPEQYQQHYMDIRNRLTGAMQMSGDPSPEGEIAALHDEIEQAAFDEMVNAQLRRDFLSHHGWPALGVEEAEAMFLQQLRLAGVEDPRAMLEAYREDPRYSQLLYQAWEQATSIMFPAHVRLGALASMDELQYHMDESYAVLTARFLLFTGEIRIPSDEELDQFYHDHPDLFTDPPTATVRYVTVGVVPSETDTERARATVDSLVLSGALPDTILLTREQLDTFAPGVFEGNIEAGDMSPLFRSPSLVYAPGLSAWHAVRIVSGASSSNPSDPSLDTLRIAHWEAPVYPGQRSIMDTAWEVEMEAESLLSQQLPWSDSLQVLDWGELDVDSATELGGMPRPLKVFALDTLWTDDMGPLMYVPSYAGSYPAFVVARRLEYSGGGLLTLEQAKQDGRLLLTASSHIQKQTSMAEAERALAEMRESGVTLGSYAAGESLGLQSTPEFTVASVRQAAFGDPRAYGGLLSSPDFADVALVAPPLEVLGPFRVGNNAILAEITTRTSPPMPSDPMLLAPLYLTVQSQTGVSAVWAQLEMLRESEGVEDLRQQFYDAVAASRADTTSSREPPPDTGYY